MRNTVIRTLLAAAVALAGALPALAQDDDFAISVLLGNRGLLAQHLQLDSAQRAGLRQLAAAANAVARPLLRENARLLGQIQGEAAAPSPDTCAIGQQVVSRHQNWLKAKAAYLKFDHDFSAILTTEQLASYQALKAAVDADAAAIAGFVEGAG